MSHASTTPGVSTDINDYHIGWVCSSIAEYRAALSVMDASRDDRQRPFYKLARIKEHNVVISRGWVGPRSEFRALKEARDMKYNFPWIRFILAVGTADSNPNSKEEVKPGDIVIGHNILSRADDNAATSTAYRKQSPARTLVNAGIAKIMLRIEQRQVEWDLIDDVLQTLKEGPVGVSRRPEHPGLRPDRTPAQSPTVHFGHVASIQGAMQTTPVGCDMAGQDSILCFDMGTADILAGGIDCLAICGIIDSAQSQDRNTQHDYTHLAAAAAAAVCAREFLTCVYRETVVEITVTVSQEQMEDIMNGVMRRLQKITGTDPLKETTAAIQQLQKDVDMLIETSKDVSQIAGEPVQLMQNSQHEMNSTLQQLSERISRQEQQASDYVTKKELQELRDKIESNRSRLNNFFEQTRSALNASGDVLNGAAEIVDNDNLRDVAKWTRFAGQTTEKLAGIMPNRLLRPGKGKERQSSTQYDFQAGPSTSSLTSSMTGNKNNLLDKSKDLLTRPFRGRPSRGPVPVPGQEQDNASSYSTEDTPEARSDILHQSEPPEPRRLGTTPIQTDRIGYGTSERSLSSMSSRSPSQSTSTFSPTYTTSSRSTFTPPVEHAPRSSSSQVFNSQSNALPGRGSTDTGVDTTSIAGVKATRAKWEGKAVGTG